LGPPRLLGGHVAPGVTAGDEESVGQPERRPARPRTAPHRESRAQGALGLPHLRRLSPC